MQDRDSWSLPPPAVDQALGHLLPRSAGSIVREVFYGAERFDQLLRRTGLPRSVLSQQLERLVAARVLEKAPYREAGARSRDAYRLTERGRGLGVVLVAMLDWSRRWLLDEGEPGVLPVHTGCGAVVHADLSCERHHTGLSIGEVEAAVGPGATRA